MQKGKPKLRNVRQFAQSHITSPWPCQGSKLCGPSWKVRGGFTTPCSECHWQENLQHENSVSVSVSQYLPSISNSFAFCSPNLCEFRCISLSGWGRCSVVNCCHQGCPRGRVSCPLPQPWADPELVPRQGSLGSNTQGVIDSLGFGLSLPIHLTET